MREKNEMTAIRQMDVESLAKSVFRRLKEHFCSHSSPVTGQWFRQRGFPSEPEDDDSRKLLLEAIALLERRGLVMRDCLYSDLMGLIRSQTRGFHCFCLSNLYGREVLTLMMESSFWWTSLKKLLIHLNRKLAHLMMLSANTISKAYVPTKRNYTYHP